MPRGGTASQFQESRLRAHGGREAQQPESSPLPWAVSELFSDRAVLTSLDQSENGNILDVEQPARSQGRGLHYPGRTIEDEQCQKVGGGYTGIEAQIFTVSLRGANIYLRRSRVQHHGTQRKRDRKSGEGYLEVRLGN
jgi:hypothetical protein